MICNKCTTNIENQLENKLISLFFNCNRIKRITFLKPRIRFYFYDKTRREIGFSANFCCTCGKEIN